jgi:NitT/TauT family transport system substrate-binding protein
MSGSVDVIATGVPPIVQLWSASAGSGRAVKAIGALGSLPFLLITTNPNVRTIADFGERDRVAVPAAKVGLQATLLQMQCAKLFGPANFNKLDHLTISMAHPDALAALLSGGRGSITAHFGQSPFQEAELKDLRVHTVLTSQDILGGAASLASTAAFRDTNPVLSKAVFAALEDAIGTINSDKSMAAELYVAQAQSKDDPKAIKNIISAPQVAYSLLPNGIMKFADFMYQTGRSKRQLEKWSDLFFPEIHDRPGS